MKGIYEIKQIDNCYLVYGTDEWIKHQFIRDLKSELLDEQSALMNYQFLEGKEVEVSTITDTCETMPFFVEKKLVVIKNSGLFKSGRKDDTDKISKWLESIPEYVVLVFAEEEVDKRNKFYKKINTSYSTVLADYPGDDKLMALFQTFGGHIERRTLAYFIENMPSNIGYAMKEFEKLLDYSEGEPITKEMIDKVCVFSLEQRVFGLIKEMTVKNTTKALKIYTALMDSKESPIGVLVLIARQYRMLLQVKYLLKSNKSQKEIASEVGVPFFVVKELSEKSSYFTFKQLEHILELCLQSDIAIKSGEMEAVKCVEMLIINCIYINS